MKDINYQTIKIEKFEENSFLVNISHITLAYIHGISELSGKSYPLLTSDRAEIMNLEEVGQIISGG